MNKKQLINLGVPKDCVPAAIAAVQSAARQAEKPKQTVPKVVANPDVYLADEFYGALAAALIESAASAASIAAFEPIEYQKWGSDFDPSSLQQIQNACRLPIARGAALMPDAHSGYGLPIGGVLACENAVIPYGVGVDIACRMKLTITDLPVDVLLTNDAVKCRSFDDSLHKGTLFGTGKKFQRPHDHEVLDEDWSVTAITRQMKDRAVGQLGTSGSGNHFVEWGVVTLPANEFGLEAGNYTALLSHSGSRGPGAMTCRRYTDIARQKAPAYIKDDPQLRHLCWLDMDSEAGQEYWLAMNLMGRFASANHEVIHRRVTKLAGAKSLATIENHHNFAWLENHDGKDVYVHRKGATPAGVGELGVIPGNMADAAFIVRGKGKAASLNSASHGAGRKMSRTKAKQNFNWGSWNDHLKQKNVRLLAGGIDEVPGAYKNIHDVMAAQSDLVETVGQFMPKIVMMCGDGSRPED
jgi:tRNA-splicing ligase RtcB